MAQERIILAGLGQPKKIKKEMLRPRQKLRRLWLKRICFGGFLTHYDEDGVVNYTSMDTNEKAFASLFEELFLVADDNDLFMSDIEHWEHKLGLDLPSFVDLIKAIDEHTGSSDWRQICYLEERQHGLLEAAYTDFENRRARALQYREREKQKESMAQALGA